MPTTFISGRALDSVDLTPLPGATITEVNNPSNTSTADNLGAFSLTVQDGTSPLILSYLGYQSIQDTATNLNGDDYLASNTKAYASLYATARQSVSALPGILVVAIVIVLLFKLFKVA